METPPLFAGAKIKKLTNSGLYQINQLYKHHILEAQQIITTTPADAKSFNTEPSSGTPGYGHNNFGN